MNRLATTFLILFIAGASAGAVTPTRAEMHERRRWTAAKFEGEQLKAEEQPTLFVVENHDAVQRNARGRKPMRLGEKQFSRGLYCHAPSKVLVKNIPAGAKAFSATVGVDSNDQTCGGRGSVVFILLADGKEKFRSETMRENSPATPVKVGFSGETEFTLIVTDSGDGISCDQADWVDAKIELSDGSEIWLGNLPIQSDQKVSTDPVFSFKLDGRSSTEILREITPKRESRKLDNQRTIRRVIFDDQKSKLAFRVEGIEYENFPTVEWTVYVNNTGSGDSGMIESLQAIDTDFRGEARDLLLHHNTGSPCLATDYQPHVTKLAAKELKRITTSGGRSTNSDLPFFNIEWSGRGAIVAMGWPGQWAAEFTRDEKESVRVVAGQELTHFKLHAGEEVRTPLVVLQFYEGDAVRAQNIWRRWMIAHNMPHPGGKPPAPMTGACSSHQAHEMIQANEQHQIGFIDRYVEEKIPLDYWWMDAGWYVNNGDWPNTGTWEVDRKRFPNGLRPITDHARSKNIRSIVWFEPERVNPGTKLYNEHPAFLLGKDGTDKLLDLGNPDARKWWLEHADALINSEGIDLYRNDFNIDPLPFWRGNDAADRQGITEIRYVEGFLSYWDELRKRRPEMLIDTCASGGRRNDLETLRRAVPHLRSDYILEPVGQQNHTMGIASWIPYFGTGVNSPDSYIFRSQMCPWITCVYDMRNRGLDYESLRKRHAEWKKVSARYLKDFYPLTPYSTEETVWVAWQFDDPQSGEGVVQAFRRANSFYGSAELKLQGLEPAARYVVNDMDSGAKQERSGAELAAGLKVAIDRQAGAVLLMYRRVR